MRLTGVLALLATNDDGVAAEELERLHGGRVELGDRVVVRRALIDDEAVGSAHGHQSHGGRVDRQQQAPAQREQERDERVGSRCRQRVNEVLVPPLWRLERERGVGDSRLLWPENGRSRVVGLGFAAGIVGHGGDKWVRGGRRVWLRGGRAEGLGEGTGRAREADCLLCVDYKTPFTEWVEWWREGTTRSTCTSDSLT